MLHKSLAKLSKFTAGDDTQFVEVLHPKNDSVDTGFSLGHASIGVGKASLPHILEKCSETYYFLQGEGKVYVDDEWTEVKTNDMVYIPAGARQYVVNTGEVDLEFLCVVEPAWYAAQEQIVD